MYLNLKNWFKKSLLSAQKLCKFTARSLRPTTKGIVMFKIVRYFGPLLLQWLWYWLIKLFRSLFRSDSAVLCSITSALQIFWIPTWMCHLFWNHSFCSNKRSRGFETSSIFGIISLPQNYAVFFPTLSKHVRTWGTARKASVQVTWINRNMQLIQRLFLRGTQSF